MVAFHYRPSTILPRWYYVVTGSYGPLPSPFIAFAVIDDFGNLQRVNPAVLDVIEDDKYVWDIQGVIQ